MTNEQFMLEHLQSVLNFNKAAMDELHDMDNTEGKRMYGSIPEFKKARSIWAGKVMQVEDLITYFKFQLKEDSDLEDTDDINDMGMNDYGAFDFIED
jgi:hypothetical protein